MALSELPNKAAREIKGEVLSGSTVSRFDAAAIITDGSTANGGKIVGFSLTNGSGTATRNRAIIGIVEETAIGDSDGAVNGGAVKAVAASLDQTRYKRTVAGLTAATQLPAEVYMTSATTCSVTPQDGAPSIGVVDEYVTTNVGWVRSWTGPMLADKALTRETVVMDTYAPTAAGVVYQMQMPYAGSVEKAFGIVQKAAASGGVSDCVVQFRVRAAGTTAGAAGTTVGGGRLTWAAADAQGKLLTASAVSSSADFNEGDWLQAHITPGGTAPALNAQKVSLQAVVRARWGS